MVGPLPNMFESLGLIPSIEGEKSKSHMTMSNSQGNKIPSVGRRTRNTSKYNEMTRISIDKSIDL